MVLKLILLTFLLQYVFWEASPKRENEKFISAYFSSEKPQLYGMLVAIQDIIGKGFNQCCIVVSR